MTTGQIVLLAYAILMLGGGLMGYRAGSRPSLVAGLASGVLLLAAWQLSRTWYEVGLGLGALLALALSVVFGMRLAKTRKLMPSGMLLAVSLIALAVLIASATVAT